MNKSKKPAIRFKGFTEDWEQRKSKMVFYPITIKGVGHLPVLSATQDKGMILREESGLNIQHDKMNEQGYKKVSPGNFVIHLRSFQGGFAHSAIEGITSPAYTVIGFIDSNMHNDLYWKHTFISSSFVKSLEKVTYGIRDGRSIDFTGFIEQKLLFPSKPEQTKIALFLDALDNLITLHQRKYDKLVNIKKSLLQKMLPKNGEPSPQLRFSHFHNYWNHCELQNCTTSFEYGLNAASKKYDGINKYIRITDIDDHSREFNTDDITSPDVNLENMDKYKLAKGDILFARTGASVGKTYIYKDKDGIVYFAGFLIRARINKEYNPNFIFQNTLTDDYTKFVNITCMRSGQPGINAKEYSKFSFMSTCIEEQNKFVEFLCNLDNLITLHQRKMEKLQNIKKSMLGKMFPQ